MNPSCGQQSEGIVISTIESEGFVLVKTRNIKPVQRKQTNLQIISSHNNNDYSQK